MITFNDKLRESLLVGILFSIILIIRFIKSLFEPHRSKEIEKYYKQQKISVDNMYLVEIERNEIDQQINNYICIIHNAFQKKSIEQLKYNKTIQNIIKTDLSFDYCISCNKIFPIMYENCPECKGSFLQQQVISKVF